MKRLVALSAPVVLCLASGRALAQAPAEDAPQPRDPETLAKPPPPPRNIDDLGQGPTSDASDLLVPTPAEWRMRYEDARAKLVTGDFADAAARFAELEASAANRIDRALAHAQRTLAAEWASRGLAFVHRQDVREGGMSERAVDKRTTDELVSLYTNAVFYGIGSGIWLGTLTQPKSVAGGVLPTIALTGASIGTVVALDSGRGFHYGVPQSIVSGMYIGLEEGIVWALYASTTHTGGGDQTATLSTIVWGSATVGALAGGALGSELGTTPGRSSWVGSTALWSGTLGGLVAGAFASDVHPEHPALVVMGLGLTLGTSVGMATASSVSPSIARVRFLDLGGLSGGLLAFGLYAAAANDKTNGHASAGVAALGAGGGLAAAWALTSSMPEDRPRTPGERPDRATALGRMRPMLLPASGGAMMGVGGALD